MLGLDGELPRLDWTEPPSATNTGDEDDVVKHCRGKRNHSVLCRGLVINEEIKNILQKHLSPFYKIGSGLAAIL